MNTIKNTVKDLAYEIFYKMQHHHDNLTVDNNNSRADSIYDGRVGALFFMLELYKATNEKSIWNSIVDEIKWIEKYSAENPTNNYSLLKGKLGLGMFYLRINELTGEVDYLNKAVAMAKEYYTSNAYFNGIISRYGLADGIAGVLLFTHELYLKTGNLWLLEHVEKYTLKLLYNCYQGENGIFWGGITNRDYKNNGYATGNTGVAFVLNRIGNSFKNTLLQKLVQKALAYDKDKLEKRLNDLSANVSKVFRLSLGYGSLGYELVNLYTGGDKTQVLEAIRKDAFAAEQLCGEISEKESYGLFSGLAGVGLALMQAGEFTNDDNVIKSTRVIANKLIEDFNKVKDNLDFTMDNALGMGYFLLKFVNSDRQHAALCIMPECSTTADLSQLPESSIFKQGNKELFETYFSSNYKKALPAVKALYPDAYNEFINATDDIEMSGFANFAAKVIAGSDTLETAKVLCELNKESFLISTIAQLKASDIYSAADILNIDRVMNLNPEEFQDLKLVQSKKVKVFSDEYIDIDLVNFDKESFINFMQFYGVNSCFYAVSSIDSLHVAPLSMLKFIYDRFNVPSDIKQVCDNVMTFFNKQDQELIEILKVNFKVEDEEHLKMMIKEYVLEGARYCMTEGLLEVLPI